MKKRNHTRNFTQRGFIDNSGFIGTETFRELTGNWAKPERDGGRGWFTRGSVHSVVAQVSEERIVLAVFCAHVEGSCS